MKRRKSKTSQGSAKVVDVDIAACRCCLNSDKKVLESGNDYHELLELLVGYKMERSEFWLCLLCRHFMKKFSSFRLLCCRAHTVLEDYRTKHSGRRKMDAHHFKKNGVQNLIQEPSFSNTLCLDVSALSTETLESCPISITSFAKDGKPEKNYTDNMETSVEEKVKLETIENAMEINAEMLFQSVQPDVAFFNENSNDFNAFDVKEELFFPGDDFVEDVCIVKEKKRKVKKDRSKKEERRKSKRASVTSGEMDRYLEVVLTHEEQLQERRDRAREASYTSSAHRCQLCVLPFKHQHTLDTHMRKHCESRGPYECPLCHQRFPRARTLASHRRVHAARLLCHACGARVRDRARLREHLDWHRGATYSCGVCGRVFSRRTTLQNHLRLKHGQGRYECDTCGKVFAAKERLKVHQLRHQPTRQHECPACPKAFYTAASLSLHRATHLPSADHYCVECDRHYKSANILKMHLERSSKHRDPTALKHACTRCSRRYTTAGLLAAHVSALHDRVALLECEACGARYATRHGLNFHRRRAHQGFRLAKKHQCRTCDKAFTSKALLINHTRTHTGERPFECSSCQRKFTQKSAMQTHIKLVHLKLKRNVKSRKKTTIENNMNFDAQSANPKINYIQAEEITNAKTNYSELPNAKTNYLELANAKISFANSKIHYAESVSSKINFLQDAEVTKEKINYLQNEELAIAKINFIEDREMINAKINFVQDRVPTNAKINYIEDGLSTNAKMNFIQDRESTNAKINNYIEDGAVNAKINFIQDRESTNAKINFIEDETANAKMCSSVDAEFERNDVPKLNLMGNWTNREGTNEKIEKCTNVNDNTVIKDGRSLNESFYMQ